MLDISVDGEIRLMKAIVVKALEDAVATLPSGVPAEPKQHKGRRKIKPKYHKYRCVEAEKRRLAAMRQRDAARRWLTANRVDFRQICFFAELDPDYILRKVKMLASAGWPRLAKRAEMPEAA